MHWGFTWSLYKFTLLSTKTMFYFVEKNYSNFPENRSIIYRTLENWDVLRLCVNWCSSFIKSKTILFIDIQTVLNTSRSIIHTWMNCIVMNTIIQTIGFYIVFLSLRANPTLHRQRVFENNYWACDSQLPAAELRNKQVEFNPYIYTFFSKLFRFWLWNIRFWYTTGRYSEQPPEQQAHTSRQRYYGKMDVKIFLCS